MKILAFNLKPYGSTTYLKDSKIYNLLQFTKFYSRNKDSGKVLFLEKQEYVNSCKTHDIR